MLTPDTHAAVSQGYDLVEIVIAIFQAIIILFLMTMKAEMKHLWGRVNNHGHSATCSEDGCKVLVDGVLVRGGQE